MFGFGVGFVVIGTWLIFINVPIPEAQASGSSLISQSCGPAQWLGSGPQTVRGDFKAEKSISCDIVLDHRMGNPETLKALAIHDLEAGARQIIVAAHDVNLENGHGAADGKSEIGKASIIELIHERTVAGNDVLAQDETLIHADANHFRIVTHSHQILRGTFFASQLKGQNRDVTVERLPENPGQTACGHFRVTMSMGIEFQKTLKAAPPAIFTSDSESLATKAFDQTLNNTLQELGRRL